MLASVVIARLQLLIEIYGDVSVNVKSDLPGHSEITKIEWSEFYNHGIDLDLDCITIIGEEK